MSRGSHLSQHFKELLPIHAVKGFGVIYETRHYRYVEFLALFNDLPDIYYLFPLVPLPDMNPASSGGICLCRYILIWLFRFCKTTLLLHGMGAIAR